MPRLRWLIASLGLGVIALGVWLLASLRGRQAPVEVPPARTVAAPPERQTIPPGAPRGTIAPPPPDAGRVLPPAPERQENPRAFYQDRLDRERRELGEARQAAEVARKRPNVDPGEVRAMDTRVNDLERLIRADESRLEKAPQ
jgi:hypothetical protein